MNDNSLSFEYYKGKEGLSRLFDPWLDLLSRVSGANYTYFPQCYMAYLNNLAFDSEKVFFFCLKRNERLIAIFPMVFKVITFYFISLRILMLPMHEDMRLVDFIIDRQEKAPGKLFVYMLEALKEKTGLRWDLIYFPGVIKDGSADRCVNRQKDYLVIESSCSKCKVIPVTDYQLLFSGLSKNFRHNIHKAHNRLEKETEVKFENVTDPDRLDAAFEDFVKLEASGWKGRKGTAIAFNDSLRGYYRQLLEAYAKIGQAEIAMLKIRSSLIAALYVLKVEDTAYFNKIGYDESRGYLSPGNLLIEWQLKRYYEGGKIKWLNLITDAPYMDKWRPKSLKICIYVCFNKSLKGIIAGYLAYAAFFIKRRLPYKHVKKLKKYMHGSRN